MVTEDFTTWTETDPGDDITVTSTKVDFNLPRNVISYVYSDKGAGHFDGDFEHLFELYIDSYGNGMVATWMLSNQIAPIVTQNNHIELWIHNSGLVGLREEYSSTDYSDTTISCNVDTLYYLKIKRDEAVGTYGTIYCYIYSDASRETLVDTLSVALHEKIDWQYIYAVCGRNDSLTENVVAYVQNMDLQEGPAPVASTITQLNIGDGMNTFHAEH